MKTILCIDDDKDQLISLSVTLETEGYKVINAMNSTDGFNQAKACHPDMIILDVMMDKETDGFLLSYKFRKDEDLKTTPILMLTSINQKTGFKFNPEIDGNFLPVDDFIEKPAEPDLLARKVKKLLDVTTGQTNTRTTA